MLMLLACALVAGAFGRLESAEAQAPDIDLGVAIEMTEGGNVEVVLTNHGRDAAQNVTVVIEVPGFPFSLVTPVLGTPTHPPGDNTTILWRIPRLPANSRYPQLLSIDTLSHHPPFMVQVLATVTSDFPEAEELEGNNEAEVWTVWQAVGLARLAIADLGLQAAVDDFLPSPGNTVEFTVTIEAHDDHVGANVQVMVTLTGGLVLSSSSITRSDGDTLTSTYTHSDDMGIGTWDIGIWFFETELSRELALTVQVPNDAMLNEPCLTVTLSSSPQEAASDDNPLADNSDKICLGETPAGSLPVLFQGGPT